MQRLRRNSAREYAKSIDEVGEDPVVAGNETVAGIEAECLALGLGSFAAGGDKLEDQERLRYTRRAQEFTDELDNKGAYSIYSASAHAELAGIWRMFGQTSATFPARQPLHSPVANPEASFAAADSALKAMMGPIEQIALLFGWTVPGRAEEISATIELHEQRDEPAPAVSWPARDLHHTEPGGAHTIEAGSRRGRRMGRADAPDRPASRGSGAARREFRSAAARALV